MDDGEFFGELFLGLMEVNSKVIGFDCSPGEFWVVACAFCQECPKEGEKEMRHNVVRNSE